MTRVQVILNELNTFIDASLQPVSVFQLNSKGLSEILNKEFLNQEEIRPILELLNKSIGHSFKEELTQMISESFFFREVLPSHLQKEEINAQSETTIRNVIVLMETVLLYQPFSCIPTNELMLPLINKILCTLRKCTGSIYTEEFKRIDNLFITIKSLSLKRNLITELSEFRMLPVYPTADDIYNFVQGDLPINIVDRGYDNVEQYLNIQYRLLREDLVRPYRDCILKYRENLVQDGVTETENCHLYLHAKYIDSAFEDLGQCVILEVAMPKSINWESSKRFLPGNLICFSIDNFQTVSFAIVRRKLTYSSEMCRVSISVIDDTFKEATIRRRTISLIESKGYYEAYKHILTTLKSFDIYTFPLFEYLVTLEQPPGTPSYINSSTVYSEKVKNPEEISLCSKKSHNYHSKVVADHFFLHDSNKKSFSILERREWPTAKELDLDKQQFEAFCHALTRNVALIHGPPGTGKTFLGLKIINTLINNVPVSVRSSILVVCFTNNGLDQFLQGLLSITTRVVRLGGRSKCKTLEPHLISNISFPNKEGLQSPLSGLSADIARILTNGESPNASRRSLVSLKKEKKDIFDQLRIVRGELKQIDVDPSMSRRVYNEISQPHMRTLSELFVTDEEDTNHLQDALLAWLQVTPDLAIRNSPQLREMAIRILKEENLDFTELGLPFPEKKDICATLLIRIVSDLNSELLDEEDVPEKMLDISNISVYDRWRLFIYWVRSATCKLSDEYKELLAKYEKKTKECDVAEARYHYAFMKGADVVGATTTGASKYRLQIEMINPKIVIIEEAAEVLEGHAITSLTSGTRHLILIGDHKQLRPNALVHELNVNYNLGISMFERLINNRLPCVRLQLQYRMRPSIADLLVPEIYETLEHSDSVKNYPNVRGVKSNIFFLDHAILEDDTEEAWSHANKFEAEFMIALCRYLIRQGYKPKELTILVCYNGQYQLIKDLVDLELMEVTVATVDNYQGKENEIILISFVRSNEEKSLGFVRTSNRVCVALSRAKQGLYCIGNFSMFADHDTLWQGLVTKLRNQKFIGQGLPLCCQTHSETFVMVKSAEDIESFLSKGCQIPCTYKPSCGHQCPRTCHHHLDHETMWCTLCTRKSGGWDTEEESICNKENSVEKQTESNEIRNPDTHLNVNWDRCNSFSEMPNMCEEVFTSQKNMQKEKIWDADTRTGAQTKHSAYNWNEYFGVKDASDMRDDLPLRDECSWDKWEVDEICNEILTCKHKCPGYKKDCQRLHIHEMCNEKCELQLTCGHPCNGLCDAPCRPCKEKCLFRCPHSICRNTCQEKCSDCDELSVWVCEHISSKLHCRDEHLVHPCSESCKKKLCCGHLCTCFCGEPCPEKCFDCDSENYVTATNNRTNFVYLEYCCHVVHEKVLEEHLSKTMNTLGPRCPKCCQLIEYNRRFVRMIKSWKNGNHKKSEDDERELSAKVKILLRNELNFIHHPNLMAILKLAFGPKRRASLETLKHLHPLLVILLTMYSGVAKISDSATKLQSMIKDVLSWMEGHLTEASYKQLADCRYQVTRLKLLHSILQMEENCLNHGNQKVVSIFRDLVDCVWSADSFCRFNETSVRVKIIQLKELDRSIEIDFDEL